MGDTVAQVTGKPFMTFMLDNFNKFEKNGRFSNVGNAPGITANGYRQAINSFNMSHPDNKIDISRWDKNKDGVIDEAEVFLLSNKLIHLSKVNGFMEGFRQLCFQKDTFFFFDDDLGIQKQDLQAGLAK